MITALKPYIQEIYGDLTIKEVAGLDYMEFLQGTAIPIKTALLTYNGYQEFTRYESGCDYTESYSLFIRLEKEDDEAHRTFRDLLDSAVIQTQTGMYYQISIIGGSYIRPDKSIIIFEHKIECYPAL